MDSAEDSALNLFEDIWDKNVSGIENPTLKYFYDNSLYNVEVKILPRKKRTAAHVLPMEPMVQLPIHTKELIHFYTSDYVAVQHSNESRTCETSEKEEVEVVNMKHEYEIDIPEGKFKAKLNNGMPSSPTHSWTSLNISNVEHDNLLLALLQNHPPNVIDKTNEKMRSDGRQVCLFSLCSAINDDSFRYLRIKPNIPEESITGRILVECLQLKLELEVEPIYASMALYDITTKKKLSENFHFDMNPESLKKMLPTYDSSVTDSSTMSHSGIFRISHPTSGLYLLIRLEKVLQGDIDKCTKPYIKQHKSSGKLKEKTALYCWRLGKYRMPFAWTAISIRDLVAGSKILDNPSRRNTVGTKSPTTLLLSETTEKTCISTHAVTTRSQYPRGTAQHSHRGQSGKKDDVYESSRRIPDMGGKMNLPWSKNLDTFTAVTVKLKCFLKQDLEYLSDTALLGLVKHIPSRKKQDLIPGSLHLRISPCPKEVKCCLSPEMVPINPCPGEINPPIRELLEFPYKEIIEPHSSYRNLMYIYPKNFSTTGRQSQFRNITVKVELREIGQKSSIPLIYGKSSGPKLVSKMYTAVSYHKRHPEFLDEIKLSIPANFNKKYFLLFEFYHLNCSKKSELDVETCIGFSWIPLFINGELKTGEFDLPVIKEENVSVDFSELPIIRSGKGLDYQKGVFKVMLKAVSSLHPQDQNVGLFLKSCSVLKEVCFPNNAEKLDANAELIFSLVQLPESDTRSLVKFLPILLNKIIWLIINSSKHHLTQEQVGKRAFKTLVQIVNKVALHGSYASDKYRQNCTLVTFVHYQSQISHASHDFNLRMNNLKGMQESHDNQKNQRNYDNTNEEKAFEQGRSNSESFKLLHEELFFHLINSESNTKELALNNIWFFFDLIIKSVIEDLHWKDGLKAPRKQRVSEEFKKSTTEFLEWILINIHQKPKSEEIGMQLIISIAHFLSDLLCIVDRGWVFTLIKNVSSKIPADLQMYKLDFLQVICHHAQFIPLNLFGASMPLPISGQIDSEEPFTRDRYKKPTNWLKFDALFDLSSNFKKNHFLVGLLLASFQNSLTSEDSSLHEKAISGLYNLLSKLDRDTQYQHPSKKIVLASLFTPLVGITMRTLPQLKIENKSSTSGSINKTGEESRPSSLEVKESFKMNVSKSSFFLPVDCERYSRIGENFSHFSYRETCGLLMCFLWVIKHVDKSILKSSLPELSPKKIGEFLELLVVCLTCFEHKEKKQMYEKKYSTSLNNISSWESCAHDSGIYRGNQSASMGWNSFMGLVESPRHTECDTDKSGNFSAEVSLIVLDCLEMMAEVFPGTKHEQTTLEMVIKTLLEALGKTQSIAVLGCMLSTQRSLVNKFPQLFFDDESELCKDLCLRLLCHCSSILSSIRAQASLSIYLLMRQSFQVSQNFSWVKLQLTVAVSTLVATYTEIREEKIHKSLKNIIMYAEADTLYLDTPFPEQVKELVYSLHVILSDTMKIKEAQPDTEMLFDLMHRIANAHRSSPHLRLTWLINMAHKHIENGSHAEAAMCVVHCAALVAEYMNIFEAKRYFPRGAIAFERISPNALEESMVFEEKLNVEEGGLGKYFTESGMVGLLEQAATSFYGAKLYEAMNEVYKIMIPIAEAERNYKKLANIHSKLHDAFTLIEKNKKKRVFGTYYRVAFYGDKFGDLNEYEFIYKEPNLTKLSEIFNRLQTFYQERFGAGNVIVIKDSNVVNKSELQADKLYIQITYVEPYFENHELKSRVSIFEKNFTIKKFMYATPFTPHGRPHGNIAEQWKRKTFLTTSHHFPYIKRRIPVVEKDEIVLTPIEVAIEDIQSKTLELAATVEQEPPDAKMLQMVLQGCIGTTVNQGPKEVAVVFLSDLLEGNAKHTNFQKKLCLCFKEFAKQCNDGLRKNEKIILPEQLSYQQELEKNFWKFVDYLEPLIHIKSVITQKCVYLRKESETEC